MRMCLRTGIRRSMPSGPVAVQKVSRIPFHITVESICVVVLGVCKSAGLERFVAQLPAGHQRLLSICWVLCCACALLQRLDRFVEYIVTLSACMQVSTGQRCCPAAAVRQAGHMWQHA
jgi:hypothetical protein